MILYHGSKNIINKPVYGVGNPNNDYGLGFYCTLNKELAKEWACSNSSENGYCNKYELDIDNLKILDLTKSNYSILHWLALLLSYRFFDVRTPIANMAKEYIISNYKIDIKDYDVIIGYRADDSYFSFAKDFLNNAITLEELELAMKLGELGIQIVLKSKEVFNKINFIEYEEAESEIYYVKRVYRDKKAREEYFHNLRNNVNKNGKYISDIIRKGR